MVDSDVARKYGQAAVIRTNSKGKITLLEQSDELRDVIRGAMDKVLVGCAWDNAFPTIANRATFVRPLLVEAAGEIKALKIQLRAEEDYSFSKDLASLVCCAFHLGFLYTNSLSRFSNGSITNEISSPMPRLSR